MRLILFSLLLYLILQADATTQRPEWFNFARRLAVHRRTKLFISKATEDAAASSSVSKSFRKLTLVDGISEWGTYEEIMAIVQMADILEFNRGLFYHLAMYWREYQGRGVCIHVTKAQLNATAPVGGLKGLDYLDEVMKTSQCRINNKVKEARRKGLVERPKLEQIAEALEGLMDDDQIGKYYNLIENNCETSVTKWKYGRGFSTQVETYIAIAGLRAALTGRLAEAMASYSRNVRNRTRIGGAKVVARLSEFKLS